MTDKLSERFYNWLREQKYGDENILHSSVCCDFVGQVHFKKELEELISDHIQALEAENETLKEEAKKNQRLLAQLKDQ